MADETKKYLINVESNLDEYIAKATKAKEEVDKMKESVDRLKAAKKTEGEEWERANADLRNAQKEYGQAKKLVDLQTTANKSNAESRKQLAAMYDLEKFRLGALKDQYTINEKGQRVLSASYLDSVKKVKDAKDAIIAYDKAQSDGRSSVGLYSEALDGALGKFSAIPGPVGKAASAIQTFGTGLKALLLNPVGLAIAAIVAAVAGLIAIFKKFDPIVEKVERGLAALGAVFTTITQGIGNFLRGQASLKESFSGIGEKIKQAADEGIRWKQVQQDLEDMTSIQMVSDAKLKRQIDELMLQSNNRTKTEEERMQLIDQALLLEEAQYDARKKIAIKQTEEAELALIKGKGFTKEELELLRQKGVAYAIEQQNRKSISDAEIKAYASALANQESVLNDSIILQEKAMNRRDVLEDKAAEKRAKRQEEEAKALEKAKKEMADTKAQLEKEVDLQLKYIRDRTRAEAEAIAQKKQQEIDYQQWLRDQSLINAQNMLEIKTLANENEWSIRRQQLELQRRAEVDAAKQTGAEIGMINQKYALYQVELAESEKDAKLMIAENFSASIATLFGENTALGRIAAVAATTINTYRGAMSAFAETPGGIIIKSLAAASAVALGLASVKKILSTKSGLPGDKAGGSISTPTAISASAPAQRATAQSVGSSFLTQPQLTQSQVNALPNTNMLSAEDIANAVSKLKPPVVTVEDINAKTAAVKKVEIRATI
jgi:hypothetical protein